MIGDLAKDYKQWLSEIKQHIRQSQIKAAVRVNTELLRLYWHLGKEIAERRAEAKWGNGFFNTLSRDLKADFPDMQGFSPTNLKYCKRFYLFYSQSDTIHHQVGDELISPIFSIPWRHHIEILTKCRTIDEALFYVGKTLENGWSRAVLLNFLDARLFETQGKALTNFRKNLPEPMSDLAQQTLKDPYNFDFLTMRENYNERELEDALTTNITRFLLELGSGFAFVGRQVRLEVNGNEYFIDLLFYHLKLRCYTVVELKVTEFKPEYLGQLGFYVTAVNRQFKRTEDNPTIGLIICKTKDRVVAEYALEGTNQPLGISQYDLMKVTSEELKNTLPSIEEIENELNEK
jgi:predicted nuclease of restriction endonuclease-like (RecB) superfamily